MKGKNRILLLLACLLPLVSACSYDDSYDAESPAKHDEGKVRVSIGVGLEQMITKSSYSTTEGVKNFTVLVTQGAGVLESAYSSNGSAVELNLSPGSSYNFYVLANMGDIRATLTTQSQVLSYQYPVSWEFQTNGLPMAGSETTTVDGNPITVHLTRLVARYELRWDGSNISPGSMSVMNVEIKNTASVVSPFGGAFKATSGKTLETGDVASSSDIASLNAGSGVYFYVPENIQGIEAGITDPKEKLPKNENGAFSYTTVDTDYATYIELTCAWSNGNQREVKYRVMLGENATTSFDIKRNTKYVVTVAPSSFNTSSAWWKCEVGDEIKVLDHITISPTSKTLYVGDSQAYTVTAHWGDGTTTDVSGSATLSSSNTSATSIAGRTVTGSAAGSATITASFSYNGTTKTATSDLTVKNDVVTSITFDLSGTTIIKGEYVTGTVKANYESGRTNVDVTSLATLSSNATGVASISGMRVNGVAKGSATITASFGGKTATKNVSVVEDELQSITLTLASSSIIKGNTTTATVSATYSISGTRDVTSSATITSGTTSVATVSGSTITGQGKGTSTITASFGGKTNSKTLTVVEDELQSINLTLTNSTINNTGSTTTSVTPTYSLSGTHSAITSGYTLTSSNTSVATISGTTVIAKADGQTTITATYGGKTSSKTLTVASVYVDRTDYVRTDYGSWGSWSNYGGTYTGDSDYWASLSLSSTSIHAYAQNVSVSNVSAGHTRTTYQDQRRYRDAKPVYRDHYSDGTYGSEYYANEYTDYDERTNTVSSTSVSDGATWSVSGTGFSKSGSNVAVTANTSSSSTRTGTVTVTNSTSSSGSNTYYITQEKDHETSSSVTGTSYGSWGSWTNTGNPSTSNTDYWVSVSVGNYTSSSSPAPYTGGSASVSVSGGHTSTTTQNQYRTRSVTYTTTHYWCSGDTSTSTSSDTEYDYQTVVTNTSSVSDSPSWSVSGTGFSKSGSSVSIAENTSTSSRSGTVSASNGGASDSKTVYQAGKPAVVKNGIALYLSTDYVAAGDFFYGELYWTYSNGTKEKITDEWSYDAEPSVLITEANWNSSAKRMDFRAVNNKIRYGTVTISVSYGGYSTSASTYVDKAAATVTHALVISPTSSMIQTGATQSYSLYYKTYEDDVETSSVSVKSEASWSSSSPSVATVSGGTATGRSSGSTTITASYNGYSASASLSVYEPAPTVTGIRLDCPSSVSTGELFYVTLYVQYSNGREETVSTSEWSYQVSSPTMAWETDSSNDYYVFQASFRSGQTTISTTYNGYSASQTVYVQ